MISFVWSDDLPLYTGRGGTETFTIGQIRELQERGIDTRVLTLGLGKDDGRQYHKDIEFKALRSPKELSKLDDTIVYVNFPYTVPTKHPNFVFFHYPPLDKRNREIDYAGNLSRKSTLITNSRASRRIWTYYLSKRPWNISVVYPFADPMFAQVPRPAKRTKKTRVLFAGRLLPDKGIYQFMEMLHHNVLKQGFEFTVTTAGDQTDDGKLIADLLQHHPWLKVEEARHTPKAMAELYSRHDIVAMPSQHLYWQEAFGMVSVEAQHAGCRVVATKAGGLPETDCGLLELFQPGNSYDMALKIAALAKLPPVTPEQRAAAAAKFTRAASVDQLLRVIKKYDEGWPDHLRKTGVTARYPRLPKNLTNLPKRRR